MMKPSLQQLLPAAISNETAFQLVVFVRNLSLALESIYFDDILSYTSECEHNPFPEETSSEQNPF